MIEETIRDLIARRGYTSGEELHEVSRAMRDVMIRENWSETDVAFRMNRNLLVMTGPGQQEYVLAL